LLIFTTQTLTVRILTVQARVRNLTR
jgi:hypothetical protein